MSSISCSWRRRRTTRKCQMNNARTAKSHLHFTLVSPSRVLYGGGHTTQTDADVSASDCQSTVSVCVCINFALFAQVCLLFICRTTFDSTTCESVCVCSPLYASFYMRRPGKCKQFHAFLTCQRPVKCVYHYRNCLGNIPRLPPPV